MAAQALAGVRVLDLTRILAGPTCTQLLGDLGAEVLKIERPGAGDDTRKWGPPYVEGQGGAATAESAYYLCANRNKRSLALDLASDAGREVARRLLATADVVVHNLLPRSAVKLGLSYDAVRELRPDVVHCAISGYGAASDRPGYDYVLQARGGLMSITGEPDGEPMKVGVALTDLFTGLNAVIAIQAALAERARSGQGQAIDLALYDSSVAMLANVASSALVSGADAARYGNAHASIVPYQLFRTRDGSVVVAVGNDRQFRSLCEVLGRPELADDPAYATNDQRVQARAQLVPLLEALIAGRGQEELSARLEERGVPVGPVRTVTQALAAQETVDRDLVWQVPHPLLGTLPLVASPLKLGRTPPRAYRPPPLLGEHSAQVLAGLGYDGAAVDALVRDGVVGQLPPAAP